MKKQGSLRKLTISEEQFRRMIVSEKLTHHEIALSLGINDCTVREWCKRFGIARAKHHINPALKMSISEEEFRDLVVNQRMSDIAIAKQVGVCNVTVMHWRQRFGIARPRSANKPYVKPAYGQLGPAPKFLLSADQLREMYVTKGMSQTEIGNEVGVSQALVSQYLRRYGITTHSSHAGRKFLPEAELRRLYLEEELSMAAVAEQLKCGESTVRQNIIRLGIGISPEETSRRRGESFKERYAYRYEHKGYIQLRMPDHPSADQNGCVPEHRLVAEKSIGRTLRNGEKVHHINLQKRDNAVTNLAVLPGVADHARVHRYMERVAAYLCGLTSVMPEPVSFGEPVFWGGRYVKTLDLIQCARMNALQPALPVAERNVAETVN